MSAPLAERMRPAKIDDFVGQEHLVGKDGVIRKMIETNNVGSFILWGPPGTGKTTLANIVAKQTGRYFFKLSAIDSGVKDVREVIEKAKKIRLFNSPAPILFIDEIHRFNKRQQDALLGSVESGDIVLIGATTENPSFEVIPALLSRCNVFVLKHLSKDDLLLLIENALKKDVFLKDRNIKIVEYEALLHFSGGDARKLLNTLENAVNLQKSDPVIITNDFVKTVVQKKTLTYDKQGEEHYNVISAFIKSVRGSDPDAAVYWLARMIEAGEDVKFIARRLIILAAEDIGLANPNALLMAQTCFEAVNVIGLPEARIILSEATIYLATSPKSNSAYMAINKAQEFVRKTGNLPVPLHLRNAPTSLMKDLNYGSDYKYPHSFEDSFVKQNYLPDEAGKVFFYVPKQNPAEQKIAQRLNKWWKDIDF